MSSPRFSIIIPAYNNAEFLGEAIQSVLDQTYPDFEIMVVNDASPDNNWEVVSQFNDPRIKYIEHKQNMGLSAARNTGIRESSGEYIALLDGDDLFLPNKLQAHLDFLIKHPEIGVTYNPRFELNHSSKTIRELWRPPVSIGLADLILGFPFGPSDMVIRRDWAFRVNLFDEGYTYFGEDLDINCRLALEGCRFASVDRALNYRRYHSGRVIRNFRKYQEDELRPLYKIFADPRFPESLVSLREIALANRLLGWTNMAFDQNEIAFAWEYCSEAIRLNPSILDGKPCKLLEAFILYSILDERRNHEEILHRVFENLPTEIESLRDEYQWAVGQGYLLRGTRAIMWGRIEDGQEHFSNAAAFGVQLDKSYLMQLSAQLLSYEAEFGKQAAEEFARNISPYLSKLGNREIVKWFNGYYSATRAFQSYRTGKYKHVPKDVFIACANNPHYLTNRGVWAILLRSIMNRIKNTSQVTYQYANEV